MKSSATAITFSSLLTLPILFSPAFAEESAQGEDQQENKIVITSTQTLPGADGLDEASLNSSKAATSDTASLLKKLLGVNVQQGGGVSGLPVIRGMSDDRLRVKVDGMDLISSCGNHMNPPLSYIDPTQVSSATVFAGISPVSVGGDSIGSTILVDSAKPEFAETDAILTKGDLGLSYRTNGNEQNINLGFTVASDNLSFRYAGSNAKADNYTAAEEFKPAGLAAAGQEYLDGDEVGSTMYKSKNHSVMLAWQLDEQLWQFNYGKQDIPYQAWANQRMDMTRNDSTQMNLSYESDTDWGELKGRLYREKTRHTMQFYKNKLFWYGPNATAPATDGVECETLSGGMNGCAAGMPMDTQGDNKGLNLTASFQLGDVDIFRIGTDIQRYSLDDWWEPSGRGMWPNTFWNINQGERDRNALFGEWESKIDEFWKLQTGIRYEQVNMNAGEVQGYNPMMANYGPESTAFNAADRRRTDDNLDLTLLARYQWNSDSSVEFGYARKTRSPSVYERYSWSTGGMVMRMINFAGDGNGYVGNLNLKPETSHTLSATMDWQVEDDLVLTVNPYYTKVDDYIDAERCVSANMNCGMMNQAATETFVYLQFVNQDSRLYGVDFAADKNLINNKDWGNVNLNFQVSYTKGKNTETNDNLYNIMPLNTRLTFEQKLNDWNNQLEIEWVGSKDDVSATRNELETDSFTLVNLSSSYSWTKDLRLDFGIENLFDKFYNHPLAGVYLGQGKTMPGNGVAWGTAVPGKGRSIYLAMNLSF